MEIANINDLDPISLEPIKSIKCLWYYKFKKKIYAYDAWEWLDWFCTAYSFEHPVFKNQLNLKDVYSLFDTCSKDKSELSLHQKALLDQCVSNKLFKFKHYDSHGKLTGVELRALSPMKIHKILDVQDKYNDTKKMMTKIRCTAVIKYQILDHNNIASNIFTLYL